MRAREKPPRARQPSGKVTLQGLFLQRFHSEPQAGQKFDTHISNTFNRQITIKVVKGTPQRGLLSTLLYDDPRSLITATARAPWEA